MKRSRVVSYSKTKDSVEKSFTISVIDMSPKRSRFQDAYLMVSHNTKTKIYFMNTYSLIQHFTSVYGLTYDEVKEYVVNPLTKSPVVDFHVGGGGGCSGNYFKTTSSSQSL